jgi:hypothetical protein
MYFVESTHNSHHDNTGLLPNDERYKPTSKQKNAVSDLSFRRFPLAAELTFMIEGERRKRSLGIDSEIWVLVDVLLHRYPRTRHPE